jgi:hypothetical protein
MIMLYLNVDLARHIAEHLPADDSLRTGLAEQIAAEEILPCPEPPALTILQRGKVVMEVYDEAEAQRIEDVLSAPWAWTLIQQERKKAS